MSKDLRLELLVAVYTATAVEPHDVTAAALERGHSLFLTDAEIHQLLERSHDEKQI